MTRAVEQQVIARNPCDVFRKRLPKVERHEMTTLTTEQAQQLLAALCYRRIYWPVLIALAPGMRRGEILALRWRNVDLDRGLLRVAERLGHSTIDVTLDLSSHVTEPMQEEAAAKLDRAFRSAINVVPRERR